MLDPRGDVDRGKVGIDVVSTRRLTKELQSLICDGFGCRETD
jgi:hypothetical protein